jgi:hypothetical protein
MINKKARRSGPFFLLFAARCGVRTIFCRLTNTLRAFYPAATLVCGTSAVIGVQQRPGTYQNGGPYQNYFFHFN